MNPSSDYQAVVNDTFEVSDLSAELDVTRDENGHYHLIVDGQAYRAEVVDTDWAKRTVELRLNGQSFHIRIKDPVELSVERLGLNAGSKQEAKDITAPMPGLVLKIPAGEGRSVTAGEVLIILEAMKMENAIKAPADGTVKAVHVSEGQAVDKRQLLIEME